MRKETPTGIDRLAQEIQRNWAYSMYGTYASPEKTSITLIADPWVRPATLARPDDVPQFSTRRLIHLETDDEAGRASFYASDSGSAVRVGLAMRLVEGERIMGKYRNADLADRFNGFANGFSDDMRRREDKLQGLARQLAFQEGLPADAAIPVLGIQYGGLLSHKIPGVSLLREERDAAFIQHYSLAGDRLEPTGKVRYQTSPPVGSLETQYA